MHLFTKSNVQTPQIGSGNAYNPYVVELQLFFQPNPKMQIRSTVYRNMSEIFEEQ